MRTMSSSIKNVKRSKIGVKDCEKFILYGWLRKKYFALFNFLLEK